MQPSWRKPTGVFLLLAWLALYAGGVAQLSGAIGALPGALQAVVYLPLGLAWMLPLKPLLVWMNTGRLR
jgi:hypothetical protein